MIQHTTHQPDDDAASIVEHPDGFYWIDAGTGLEFGPFKTAQEALADMQSTSELIDDEADLGLADWVDPETGELSDDSVPRWDE